MCVWSHRLSRSVPPFVEDVATPCKANKQIADNPGQRTKNETTQQKRLPDMVQPMQQPVPADLKMEIMLGHREHPLPNLIGKIKQGGHREGIGQPDQCDGNRDVDPKNDGQAGGKQHLKRDRSKSNHQPDKKSTRNRMPVQVPERRVVQHTSKTSQAFLPEYCFMIRHIALDNLPGHKHDLAASRMTLQYFNGLTPAWFTNARARQQPPGR